MCPLKFEYYWARDPVNLHMSQEVPGGDIPRRDTGKGNKNIHIAGLQIKEKIMKSMSFLCGSDDKESACNARDMCLIPGL